jgi:hypothetical protein
VELGLRVQQPRLVLDLAPSVAEGFNRDFVTATGRAHSLRSPRMVVLLAPLRLPARAAMMSMIASGGQNLHVQSSEDR